MPAVLEQIDKMSVSEKVQTMEYLWTALSSVVADDPPAWHADILAERRRRVESGEEVFMSLAESKRRLRAAVHGS